MMLNSDVLKGKWAQVRGEARRQWGKLTDDELDQAQGNAEKLSGLIQEKYGYARERAEREVNDFLSRFKDTDARNRETV
jgi:uncharacterized protein YjbJ (UPF0337 family)